MWNGGAVREERDQLRTKLDAAVDDLMAAGRRNAALRELATKEIAAIESDDRYKSPTAAVQVNAPLALIQVGLKTGIQLWTRVLGMLDGVEGRCSRCGRRLGEVHGVTWCEDCDHPEQDNH
jgi:hypothetical protein